MASVIKIKRSSTTGAPGSLKSGELAYSWASGVNRLYFGKGDDGLGNATSIVQIGGEFYTDLLSATAGTLTASKALIADSNSKLDNLKVDNIDLNGNTISSTDSNGNLVLAPNGTGKINFYNAYNFPTTAGTAGYALVSDGAGNITWAGVNVANTASNISGGAAGYIPYQAADGVTAFIIPGSNGTLLQSNGTTATFVTTSSIKVGAAGIADKWTTARTITLAGDLGGSVSFDGSTNFTLTATIQADSIALGTDTTGDYVATGATAGFGLSGSTTGENSTFTVTSNATSTNLANTLVFRDGAGNFIASTITADLTGNAATASKWYSARTISLGGDLAGSVIIDGSGNATLTATIQANSIELGTDTTGDYIATGATTGYGISGSTSGENATFTVNVNSTSSNSGGTIVFRDGAGNFSAGTITAALSGNATSADKWSTSRTITLAGDLGGSITLDGTTDITLTATIQANSVALGTDTTGDYIATGATAGYGISGSSTGENGSFTVTSNATSSNSASTLVFRDADGHFSAGQVALTSATISSELASTSSLANNALYVAGGVGIGGSLYVNGQTVFNNNVIFSGTATYVYSTNTVYTDNILELHYPSGGSWGADDGKDIGLRFHYYSGGDQNAFLGRATDTGYLEWYSTGVEDSTSTFTSATYGTFKTGNIILTNNTASISTTSGALVVAGGVGIGGDLYVGGTLYGNITGVITTATNADKWTTARTITLAGDLGGSITLDGSTNVTLTATIQADSVALGTDTTGNYVATAATSGYGISGSSNSEGGSFTVSSNATSSNLISTIVFRDSNGDFSANSITASLSGNAATASKLFTAREINLAGDLVGGITFDGSTNVTLTATIASNSVELGADTTGNYVATGATSGFGISGSSSIEGGSFTVSSNATSTNLVSTLVYRDGNGDFSAGTITAAISGNATSADKWSTARTITLAGDLGGSITLDGTTDITLTATIQANSIALGTDTTGDYVAVGATSGYGISGGTSGENQTFTVSIASTSSNSANNLVYRDASGNFSAGVITADLVGTASNANDLTGGATGSIPYQSSAGVTDFLAIATAGKILQVNTTSNGIVWGDIDGGTY